MAHVDVSNLSYSIPVPVKDPNQAFYEKCYKCCQSESKTLIKNITCSFKPELTAILGPSGSGKTTLIDCLSGRKAEFNIECDKFNINGETADLSKMNKISGYVAQDDILTATLTVQENIKFSADLRTPSSEKQKIPGTVKNIIRLLGLNRCKENLIGDAMIRGVSGGERKRTAIGMELAASPPIVYLDEPTTGLDSSTSLAVVRVLKELAREKTVVMSIHQPSSRIWDELDRVVLMRKGEIVFQALAWVTEMGYPPEEYENPADHIMDVLRDHGENLTISLTNVSEKSQLSSKNNEKQVDLDLRESEMPGLLQKFKTLCGRSFKTLQRQPQLIKVSIGTSIFYALASGAIFYRIDKDDCYPSDLATLAVPTQNRLGAVFFICINTWFSAAMYILLFNEKAAIFKRESASGYYSVGPYFFSVYLIEVLPSRVIPALCYGSIGYWMIGFSRTVGAFFLWFLMLLNLSICSGACLLGLSATFQNPTATQLAYVLIALFSMLHSGMFPNLATITWATKWFQYVSIIRYTLEGMTVSEYLHLQQEDDVFYKNGTQYVCNYDQKSNFIQKWMAIPDMSYSTWGRDFGLSSLLCLFFLVLTYVGLARSTKIRQ